ncbi:MAG: type II secretion system protein [Abitibacteriaceae bacterium]|nr:type II secretion system protein [Abditibacteriaceae bacterium]
MAKSVPSSKSSGFTLVELLIVCGIVLVLAGLLFSVFNSVRNKSYMTSCASNLHQIHAACVMYASDNAGLLPPYPSQIHSATQFMPSTGVPVEKSHLLVVSLHPYLHSQSVWRCPVDKRVPYIGTVYSGNNGNGLLPVTVTNSTSYDYLGWKPTPTGIGAASIDDSSGGTRLIQDKAACPAIYIGKYDGYDHQGWWNRLYYDGHSKPFAYNCSNPHYPKEIH